MCYFRGASSEYLVQAKESGRDVSLHVLTPIWSVSGVLNGALREWDTGRGSEGVRGVCRRATQVGVGGGREP